MLSPIQSLMMGQTHGSHSWMIGGIGLDTYSQKGGNDHFSNWNTLTSESGYTRHWYDNLFKLINRANTVIDMIDERVNIQYSSEEKKLAIRAEAVFFRGWAYRVLAGMYGNVPIPGTPCDRNYYGIYTK
ncbi:RagB/SusD family nutrient uptake outer membrane protein [Parabacteroides merdae]|nr:RagB/SusD family nutrient uptake outer membrane protein [Parabacteroides merdae]